MAGPDDGRDLLRVVRKRDGQRQGPVEGLPDPPQFRAKLSATVTIRRLP